MADLTEQMNRAAGELDFEKAAQMRDAIEDVRRIAEGRRRSPPAWRIRISPPRQGVGVALAMVFFVRGGKMLGREQYTLDVQGRRVHGGDRRVLPGAVLCDDAEIPGDSDQHRPDTQAIEQMLTDAKGARVYIRTPSAAASTT